MIAINVLPMRRRLARARRRRSRAWAGVLCAWFVVVGVASLAWVSAGPPVDPGAGVALEAAREQSRGLEARLKALRGQIADAERTLEGARAVGEHPDWSRLLAFLPTLGAEEVALESCAIRRVSPWPGDEAGTRVPGRGGRTGGTRGGGGAETGAGTGPGAGASRGGVRVEERFELTLTGLGLSPSAVTRLLLRLERAGVFSKVALVQTRPQVVGAAELTHFEISCQLAARREGESGAGPAVSEAEGSGGAGVSVGGGVP